MLLQLEVFAQHPQPDVDSYCDGKSVTAMLDGILTSTELTKVIRSVHMILSNHKM
jgi:hypothetical protein